MQDHFAALALVSVHKAPEDAKKNDENADKDVQRATDLVDLHYGVKVKHVQGDGGDLRRARNDVDVVLSQLESKRIGGQRTI